MECHASIVKSIGLLFLTGLMVGVSYFCTTLPGWKPQIVGWFGIVFFSLGFIAIPRIMIQSGPQVVIHDDGIEDHRNGFGLIEWDDIASLRIGSVRSTRFLCVELIDPDKYLSRLSLWRRKMAITNESLGLTAVTINFVGLRPGIHDVISYIEERHGKPVASQA